MKSKTSQSAPPKDSTRYLYWWLLLAVIFEYARPASFVPGLDILKLNTLIPMLLFLFALTAKGLRPYKEIFADPLAKWMCGYMILIALSVPIAIVTFYAFNVFKATLGYFFLFLIIARVVTTESRVLGVYFTLIAAHLFLVIANPQVILNPETRNYLIGGTFLSDGNDFSLSLCILIGPAVYLALHATTRLRQFIAWLLFAVLLLCVIATQSRGASLGAGAVFALSWFYSANKVRGLVGLAVVVLIALIYAPDEYFNRMNTIVHYEGEGSAEGRIMAWKAGTAMALDNPVFGVGVGNFPMAFGTTYGPDAPRPWMTAHSMYFLIFGELGFPGAITLMVLLVGSFLSTLRLRKRLLSSNPAAMSPELSRRAQFLQFVAASQLGFMVAGAFLSVPYYPHIFVLTGLLLAARAAVARGTEIGPAAQQGEPPVRVRMLSQRTRISARESTSRLA